MAGDWIPVRDDLAMAREVIGIAKRTGWKRREVVGALVQFWGWASNETADGHLVDADVDALVDALSLPKNFWLAMIEVGWLVEGAKGVSGVTIPHFEHWLSRGAKARLLKTRRQAIWRRVDGALSTAASTTVQYSTEENNNKNSPLVFPVELNTPECSAAWNDWLEHKKSRRESYKTTKSQQIKLKQLAQLGPKRFIAAIENSIGNNYQGIFEPKTNGTPRQEPIDNRPKPKLFVPAWEKENAK